MKDLFQFADYRAYLREYIQHKKQAGYISNRWFAQKVGINSSSWLTSVLQGKKGVSTSTANKISQVLKHSRPETEYFEALVRFNQAKTISERNALYQGLISLRKAKRMHQVKENQYEYYSTWYHSVVRAMIGMMQFKDDYADLAQMLNPPITPGQAKRSVMLLEQLGMVKKDESGVYQLTSASITTGQHLKSLAVTNYQQETVKMGWEALDRFKNDVRDHSTLTLGISEKGFHKVRDIIAEFRRKIAQAVIEDEPTDRVYQLNFQLFPMAKVKGNKMKKSAPVLFILLAILGLSLVWCTKMSPVAGTVSETTNGTVTGKIVKANGSPADSTEILLIPRGLDPVEMSIQTEPSVLTKTTNDSGSFLFVEVDTGWYNLEAVHTVERTKLLIQGIEVVPGSVTVAADTLRLAGSVVLVLGDSSNLQLGYVYVPGTSFHGRIDSSVLAAGRITLDSVAAGTLSQVLYKPESSSTSTISIADTIEVKPGDTTQVEVSPQASAKIRGRILDQDGKSIAGVWVRLLPYDYNPLADSARWQSDSLADTSDHVGRFEITGIDTGIYNLEAVHPTDGRRFLVCGFRVQPSDTLQSFICNDTLRMPGTAVIGCQDSLAVLGTRFHIPGTTIWQQFDSATVIRKEMVISSIPFGIPVDIVCHPPESVSTSFTFAESILVASRDTVHLGIPKPYDARIMGRLVNSQGLPITGANVRILPYDYNLALDSSGWPFDSLAGTTDSNGAFTVFGLDSGNYNLEASHADSQIAVVRFNIQLDKGTRFLLPEDTLRRCGVIVANLSDSLCLPGAYLYTSGTTVWHELDSTSIVSKQLIVTGVPSQVNLDLNYTIEGSTAEPISAAQNVFVGPGDTVSLSIGNIAIGEPPRFVTTMAELKDTVYIGELYRDTINAIDPEGQDVVYHLLQGPSRFTVDSVTGAVLYAPIYTHENQNTVSIEAMDPYGLRDTIITPVII